MLKIRVKLKKNYQNHWVGISEQAISKRPKQLEMIAKEGSWVPHKLKPRDVERRLFACEQLLEGQTRREILHRIVAGDDSSRAENHGDCPVVILLRQHLGRMNIHGSKVMLCVWWEDQLGVIYYELLKPSDETITGKR
nr:Mariner Mos1 transposase [Hymenolepis microstoma]